MPGPRRLPLPDVYAVPCPTCQVGPGGLCEDQPEALSLDVHPSRLVALSSADFRAYFNVADELSDPDMSLEDLESSWVAQAQRGATALDLPWPPQLWVAEDYALDHPEFVRGEPGW